MSDQEPNPQHHEVFTEGNPSALQAYREKPTLIQRVTKSMPLLITVIVHAVLFLVAGALVIQEQIQGKKTKFEAPNASDAATPQVEHRLQVARKGGSSSSSSSPVSANRIYTTAQGALQLPEMPSLPSMGSGGFGGFGGSIGGAGIGLGTGTSMNTSLGGGGLGGRGFMSLTFLGMTSTNVSKLIFIVDVNKGTMGEGRGGFEAFGVIREEIMRLIAGMPPSAQFNVILFDNDWSNTWVNLFSRELMPATVANKDAFMKWIAPVNSSLEKLGLNSAGGRIGWKPKELPESSGIDDTFEPAHWARALRAGLEMQPDTIFLITSSRGSPRDVIGETEWKKRLSDYEDKKADFLKALAKEGLTADAVKKARDAAYGKARREFDTANKAIVAKGHPPIIISDTRQIFDAAVQARLKKEGFPITLDKTGWTFKDGRIAEAPWGPTRYSNASWNDQIIHISRLQKALVPERAALNIFLFSGTKEPKDSDSKDLSDVAKRNGGRYEVLTNNRLKELKAQAAQSK